MIRMVLVVRWERIKKRAKRLFRLTLSFRL
jgi:hypothetical protein